MSKSFTCDNCGTTRTMPEGAISTGYGVRDGEKHCFDCCADQDLAYMRENDRMTLFLSGKGDNWKVTNWPGTLRVKVRVKVGAHNKAGTRYDCWFMLDGVVWWGVRYGDWTEILHCRKLKADPDEYFWSPKLQRHQLQKRPYNWETAV